MRCGELEGISTCGVVSVDYIGAQMNGVVHISMTSGLELRLNSDVGEVPKLYATVHDSCNLLES